MTDEPTRHDPTRADGATRRGTAIDEPGTGQPAPTAEEHARERRRGVAQLVGSLLVALAIAGGTIAAVTSKLGTTSVAALEAREEREKRAEDVREDRAKAREDAREDRAKAREDARKDARDR